MLAGETWRGGDKEGLRLGAVRPPEARPKLPRCCAPMPTNRKASWGDGGGLTVQARQWYCAEGITYVPGLPVADDGRYVERMRPWQPRKRDCWRAAPKTWSRATEVGTAVGCTVGRVDAFRVSRRSEGRRVRDHA